MKLSSLGKRVLVSNFTKSSIRLISEVLRADKGIFHRVKHQSELNGKETCDTVNPWWFHHHAMTLTYN